MEKIESFFFLPTDSFVYSLLLIRWLPLGAICLHAVTSFPCVSVVTAVHPLMATMTATTAAAESLQSCPTLCDPIDGSPPGSPLPGILQAGTLEWVPFPSPMRESEKWTWRRSVVSDCVRPHRRRPTRLPRPWDSPGRNTGVGCHFLLQYNDTNWS